jgi:hypothetical protein
VAWKSTMTRGFLERASSNSDLLQEVDSLLVSRPYREIRVDNRLTWRLGEPFLQLGCLIRWFLRRKVVLEFQNHVFGCRFIWVAN